MQLSCAGDDATQVWGKPPSSSLAEGALDIDTGLGACGARQRLSTPPNMRMAQPDTEQTPPSSALSSIQHRSRDLTTQTCVCKHSISGTQADLARYIAHLLKPPGPAAEGTSGRRDVQDGAKSTQPGVLPFCAKKVNVTSTYLTFCREKRRQTVKVVGVTTQSKAQKRRRDPESLSLAAMGPAWFARRVRLANRARRRQVVQQQR